MDESLVWRLRAIDRMREIEQQLATSRKALRRLRRRHRSLSEEEFAQALDRIEYPYTKLCDLTDDAWAAYRAGRGVDGSGRPARSAAQQLTFTP